MSSFQTRREKKLSAERIQVFEKAIQHPLPKFLMGTDLHQSSVKKLVRNMGVMLSKIYGCGVSLEDIMYGVTAGPAAALGLSDWCNLAPIQNATLFRIIDHTETYYDCQDNHRTFHKAINVEGVILRWGRCLRGPSQGEEHTPRSPASRQQAPCSSLLTG